MSSESETYEEDFPEEEDDYRNHIITNEYKPIENILNDIQPFTDSFISECSDELKLYKYMVKKSAMGELISGKTYITYNENNKELMYKVFISSVSILTRILNHMKENMLKNNNNNPYYYKYTQFLFCVLCIYGICNYGEITTDYIDRNMIYIPLETEYEGKNPPKNAFYIPPKKFSENKIKLFGFPYLDYQDKYKLTMDGVLKIIFDYYIYSIRNYGIHINSHIQLNIRPEDIKLNDKISELFTDLSDSDIDILTDCIQAIDNIINIITPEIITEGIFYNPLKLIKIILNNIVSSHQ